LGKGKRDVDESLHGLYRFGWAAGDVSLAAYIQSTLAKLENIDPDVSALGAVMAFVSRRLLRLTISASHLLIKSLSPCSST
jgi:hypothetical protein